MSAIDEPVNIAPDAFLDAISNIEPGVWGTPCAIRLKDGEVHDSALAWENARFGDAGKWINPQDVDSIGVCTRRMPARFAKLIRSAGESGMGYHIYVVELRDGNSFVYIAGNLGIDLVNLPDGYCSDDIVNVLPHEGRERGVRQAERFVTVEFSRPGTNH